MQPSDLITIATLGKPAEPEHSFLRPALIAWRGEDRTGDEFWWWLTYRRVKAGCAELKLSSAGSDPENEDGVTFLREASATALVYSWSEMRRTLTEWGAERGLWLPCEVLDSAIHRNVLAIIPQWSDQ